jgi:hypothetical protein
MSEKPRFGFTKDHQPVYFRAFNHLAAGSAVTRFNKWLAVKITQAVGTMWCAYAFAAIALYGLPQALRPGGEGLVSWIAQTFIQLVLLSIIIVGQNISQLASDVRAAKTFEDTELIVDRLDTRTQDGLTEVLEAVQKLEELLKPESPGG